MVDEQKEANCVILKEFGTSENCDDIPVRWATEHVKNLEFVLVVILSRESAGEWHLYAAQNLVGLLAIQLNYVPV